CIVPFMRATLLEEPSNPLLRFVLEPTNLLLSPLLRILLRLVGWRLIRLRGRAASEAELLRSFAELPSQERAQSAFGGLLENDLHRRSEVDAGDLRLPREAAELEAHRQRLSKRHFPLGDCLHGLGRQR